MKVISIPKIDSLLSYIKPYLKKLLILYQKIEKLKCKSLTKFLCICCYFYQLFGLTNEYLAYKFTVIVEIDGYRYANGVLSAENFPAISFCSLISFL